MKRNEFLAILGTLALGGGLLTGCALEGDACSTDADCGGFKCDMTTTDDEGKGTCLTECTGNTDCAVGFACGADSTCEEASGPIDGQCTTDADCPAAYTCDTTVNTCFDQCTDGSECSEGFQCNDSVCEQSIVEDPYTFVAVVSEVPPTSDDVDNTTPGPDLDAVEIRQGTASFFATGVAGNNPGSFTGDSNNYTNFQAAIGANNAHSGSGPTYECDVESQNYVSLGANDGFVVLSFAAGTEIATGDTVRVYEIENSTCSNNIVDRADVYSVWIGQAVEANTAGAIRSTWCGLGTSAGNVGGVQDFSANLATCP